MNPLELKKLIEAKKLEIKELGLVEVINTLMFGKNLVINGFFWDRGLRNNVTEREILSSLFGSRAVTSQKVSIKERDFDQVEIQLESLKLAYAIEENESWGTYEFFAPKTTFFHLWADDKPVLVISMDQVGRQSKGRVCLREVRRFIKGPWILELKKLVEQIELFESKQIEALVNKERDSKMNWLLENFGIDEQEVEEIQTEGKVPQKIAKLLNRFSKFYH